MSERIAAIRDYRRILDEACVKGRETAVERELCKSDLFYLLCVVLGRADVNKDWLFDRCREVQASPNGHLDLWAREHFKSTIITFAKTIQDILSDPDTTVGIFSVTRPMAKQFLLQIKREFESNERLRSLFPDVLWDNPDRDAPKWSENDGIIVKRKSNPKESTIEAWGLVDGQPTSKHFRIMVYDDVVNASSVSSPEMIEKVTVAWAESRALRTEDGISRYSGTRWHHNDTYRTILDRGSANERRYPATDDGTDAGNPILKSREWLTEQRRDMGPYVFAAQMLLNPTADKAQGFKEAWIKHYTSTGDPGQGMNKYLLVDPASAKKRSSDYTAMIIVGLGADANYYVLDIVRDRLNLRERADAVFELHRRWKPKGVAYERYGMMADVEYLKERMGQENYRFEITEVGGQLSKPDRIKRLVPLFEDGRVYLPETLGKTDYEGRYVDLVQSFLNDEYRAFPVPLHDDMLDALSRIVEPNLPLVWPKRVEREERYAKSHAKRRQVSSWAA